MIRIQSSKIQHTNNKKLSSMETTTNKQIEINLLIEAIRQKYGYDFRDYANQSLMRRINNFLSNTSYTNICEVIYNILRDGQLFIKFLNYLSVSVTEMFRDPFVYRRIRQDIIPLLKIFPKINIWHAGCASGEEVYSFAILLKEENLYDRTNIYATDIDPISLEKARNGIFPLDVIKKGTENYLKSGGKHSLSNYYQANFEKVIFNSSLKKNITFMTHNLAVDYSFNQMHIIICRNVLIYFNQKLQNRVLQLFSDSLIRNGFLCLGLNESIVDTDILKKFDILSESDSILKKIFFE